MERHPDFDEARWVTVPGYEGRLLLGYNPHTHVGRIGVWSDDLGHGTRIDLYEITDASDAARAWLDGFLAGNEPSPSHMFGPSIHELPDDHPRWVRWRAAVAEMRRSGSWTGGSWRELTAIDETADLPCAAWTYLGDEVWIWTGQDWVLAPDQPAIDGSPPPDAICGDENGHSSAVIDERHIRCERCGFAHEIDPG